MLGTQFIVTSNGRAGPEWLFSATERLETAAKMAVFRRFDARQQGRPNEFGHLAVRPFLARACNSFRPAVPGSEPAACWKGR
jgi:hypothetical protein